MMKWAFSSRIKLLFLILIVYIFIIKHNMNLFSVIDTLWPLWVDTHLYPPIRANKTGGIIDRYSNFLWSSSIVTTQCINVQRRRLTSFFIYMICLFPFVMPVVPKTQNCINIITMLWIELLKCSNYTKSEIN